MRDSFRETFRLRGDLGESILWPHQLCVSLDQSARDQIDGDHGLSQGGANDDAKNHGDPHKVCPACRRSLRVVTGCIRRGQNAQTVSALFPNLLIGPSGTDRTKLSSPDGPEVIGPNPIYMGLVRSRSDVCSDQWVKVGPVGPVNYPPMHDGGGTVVPAVQTTGQRGGGTVGKTTFPPGCAVGVGQLPIRGASHHPPTGVADCCLLLTD